MTERDHFRRFKRAHKHLMRPRHYDEELFERAAKGPLSKEQIGQIMNRYGPNALMALRSRKDIHVYVVDALPSEGAPKKLYVIEKVVP